MTCAEIAAQEGYSQRTVEEGVKSTARVLGLTPVRHRRGPKRGSHQSGGRTGGGPRYGKYHDK